MALHEPEGDVSMGKARRSEESFLDRLNRAAAQYGDLWDVLSKLLVPVVVSLLGLFGVVLTLFLTVLTR